MQKVTLFEQAKEVLGYNTGNLMSCEDLVPPNPENLTEISEWLALERARNLKASFVYFRRFDDQPSQPLLYIYDYSNTDNLPDEKALGEVQKNIWSSSEVPCAFIFTKDSVRVINTSQQPTISGNEFLPIYLIETAYQINKDIQQRFSHLRLDSGAFWQEEREYFSYDKSAHKTLLDKLRKVKSSFLQDKILPPELVNRLLIQCVLVRYLEEKQEEDERGVLHKVFPDGFFQKIAQADSFRDALAKGTFIAVFDKLNNPEHLNGKIFEWTYEEKQSLRKIPTDRLVSLLYQTDITVNNQMAFWDLYSFRYLPVEVVSSIYEALFTTTEEIAENGMVYTPPHLAAFLVEEAMPLNSWRNKEDYLVCDPSCGSGVFLVLAFKRLVHWWRFRNQNAPPTVDSLINILMSNLYGIDKNENAVLLTRFSLCLAVCDMLTPPEVWDKFHFPDLTDRLITDDFFNWQKENQNKVAFDLVIGNPPFKQAHKDLPDWQHISGEKIPQKQIALYFLSAGMNMVKPGGLLCLILKSSSFLYTTSGIKFRTWFLENHKVHQVIDFTLLSRNNVLWSGTEPDVIALFASKDLPDIDAKILHVVVKRTLVTHLRRRFEIDTYDFHWVPYSAALEDDFVWKCNLLEGGRLYGMIKHLKRLPTLRQFVVSNNWAYSVGYRTSTDTKKPKSPIINRRPSVPTEWLTETGIEKNDFIPEISEHFHHTGDERIYDAPHILIKSNAGNKKYIPMQYFSDLDITFKEKIIGISAPKNQESKILNVFQRLKKYNDLYRTFLFSSSPECLVYMNTVVQAKDIYSLPFPKNLNEEINLSKSNKVIQNDVLNYYQEFIRRPESGKAFAPITTKKFQTHLTRFGTLFCESLNTIYAKGDLRFRQAETGYLHDTDFIYSIFWYDNKPEMIIPKYGEETSELGVEAFRELLTLDRGYVHFQRILKIYKKDFVCFIKPNQLRYWLDSIALRDADGVLADLVTHGH
ncbi:MAG: class I SAM-dependent DNA methyltransferase [Saprospiraceae bacterium]